MIFTETKLEGAYIIQLERIKDERGFFSRAWCKKEFEQHGLISRLVQCNFYFNRKRGVLRGMHYQIAPNEETKLVRCAKGSIYDAIIDLRPNSSTYKQWIGVELNAENRYMLFVPEGFAHGYQTLVNDTEVFCQVSEFYYPEAERGVRWNDPVFGIEWPITDNLKISEKDENRPDYVETRRN